MRIQKCVGVSIVSANIDKIVQMFLAVASDQTVLFFVLTNSIGTHPGVY